MTHVLAAAARSSRTAAERTFKKNTNNSIMSLSRENQDRIQQAIEKMAAGFITSEETKVTDFHVHVNGENGELAIHDDDNNCLARVHIIEWENVQDEEIFEKELRGLLGRMQEAGKFDSLNIVKPYSFVLTDDDGQDIVDLLIMDDDTLILSEGLLEGFDEEMSEFLKHLLEE